MDGLDVSWLGVRSTMTSNARPQRQCSAHPGSYPPRVVARSREPVTAATWRGGWPSPPCTAGCKGSSAPLTMAEIPEAGLIQHNPDFNGAQREGNGCRT